MPLAATNNFALSSNRRFDRSSWITLVTGLFILTLGIMVSVASYGIPADGWLVDRGTGRYANPVYLASMPGTNQTIKPGDILIEVEGEPFDQLEAAAAMLQPARPDNWEFGETIQYTLMRDGSEVNVPITLQHPPLAPYYRPPILQQDLSALSTLIFLLMGVLLFVLRPRQRAAQLLLLFGVAGFVDDLTSWGAGVPSGVADLFSVATYWPKIILGDLLWVLVIFPVLVHFFLIFPLPKQVLRRYSLILPLVYGVPVVVSLLYILLSVSGYFVPFTTVSVIIIVIPAMLIISISLIHSLLTIKEPVARMQMRWIAFGGLVGLVGLLILAMVQEVILEAIPGWSENSGAYSSWLSLIFLLLSTVFPISLAIAVLRYRLWDIDIIINRSLVYGTLTGILAFVYFVSVVLLQGLFRAVTVQGSPIAIVISTLAIAALFSPMRRRVQQFIDRRFYRQKYDAEKILSRFAESVRDEPDLERMINELHWVLISSMQAEHVSIWLREPSVARPRAGWSVSKF